MNVGVCFTGSPFPVRDVLEIVRAAERNRFRSAWFAEDPFLRDAWTYMSACAVLTRKIKLATGVINPYTRNPVLIAESIVNIDELSGSRALLGIGAGVPFYLERIGVKFDRPLQAIRETVQIIRALIRGGEVNYQGGIFRASGVTLGSAIDVDLLGKFRRRRQIPIYIAAVRPKMLQLAGEIGDGVLLTAACSPEYVRMVAVENLRSGVERGGRKASDIDVAAYVLTCLDGTPMEERSLKATIALEMSQAGSEYLKGSGISEEKQSEIRQELTRNNVPRAIDLIDQDMLHTFSAFGEKSTCVDKVMEYVDAGVKNVIILPVARTKKKALKIVSEMALELIT